ncbi:hypothetical protein NC652_004306 [Populus alba x Populus x berolinensis]|nr:hypothetical protein NC652_004306 [Populus alba x Populus x berolinensis]
MCERGFICLFFPHKYVYFHGWWFFLVSAMIVCPSLINKCVSEHLRNQRSISLMFFCIYFSHIMPAMKFKVSRH